MELVSETGDMLKLAAGKQIAYLEWWKMLIGHTLGVIVSSSKYKRWRHGEIFLEWKLVVFSPLNMVRHRL
jgi:hypothetical protein